MQIDAKWFRANPDRNFRIRPAVGDEPPGHIIVRQLIPGVRMRRDVWVSPQMEPLEDLTDAELSACWYEGTLPLVQGVA